MLIDRWLKKVSPNTRTGRRYHSRLCECSGLFELLEERCLLEGATQDDSSEYALARVIVEHPDTSQELISLTGPITIRTYWDGMNAGDADDSLFGGNNGLDDVETEIISLNLQGNSSLGPISIALNPTPPGSQFGLLEEQVNNTPGTLDLDPFAPGSAQSFFDVFFQVDINGDLVHNNSSLQISGNVSQKPDGIGEAHNLVGAPVSLFDDEDIDTSFRVLDFQLIVNPRVEMDHFDQTVAMVTLRQISTGQEMPVLLAGPTDINVFFEDTQEGDAEDDSGDGLDEVHTEIIAMDLHGNSPLGPIQVRLDPNFLTTGQIIEQVNNNPGLLDVNPFAPGSADSFFDVWFEIEVGGPTGQTLHPQNPARMQAAITHKPPREGEKHQFIGQLPLFDQSGPVDWEIINIMHWVRKNLDWGDAPDSPVETGSVLYDTLAVNEGPSHFIVPELMMGLTIDGELDGQPTVSADGDDIGAPEADDEDGLVSPGTDLALSEGVAPTVDVFVTKPTGADVTLHGWIDYDGDGLFEPFEKAVLVIPAGTPSGTVTLTFPKVPFGSVDATSGTTYARFRLSTDPAAARPVGFAADGEVEDYTATITDRRTCVLNPIGPYLPAKPTLSWLPVTGATSYEIWFSRLFPQIARLYLESTTATSWTPPSDLPAGQFRYWVRAIDDSGASTPWSLPNTFQVRPTVISPLVGSFTNPTTFEWNPIPFAASYELFLTTSGGDEIITGLPSTSAEYTPAEALPSGPIRWWIRATGSPGGGGWSHAGHADTTPRTMITGPLSPAAASPTIMWYGVPGAGKYILQVQIASSAVVVIPNTDIPSTATEFATSLGANTYRAWVKAVDSTLSFGSGLWSRPFEFTVSSTSPEALPDLLNAGLENNDVLTGIPATLSQIDAASGTDELPIRRDHDHEGPAGRDLSHAVTETGPPAFKTRVRQTGLILNPETLSKKAAQELQLIDRLMEHPFLLAALTEEP